MTISYQAFLKKNIDLSLLGLERRSDGKPYFCTPKGANIFGFAGVDGIHFCFVRGFGETVFAISPMNCAPNFVHPIAKSFDDFLRLILACGDTAPLEHAWLWDEAGFDEYIKENPPIDEQKNVMQKIVEETGLLPMENPWQYINKLQNGFDYGKIKYTQDYYDLDMNPDAPKEPLEWKVYYDENFWGHNKGQRAGKEIAVGARFNWAGHNWIIPTVYPCAKGLVVDFCMQVKPEDICTFMEKWGIDKDNEDCCGFTKEQQMQLNNENPLSFDFCSAININGNALQNDHGCGATYNPYVSEDEDVESVGKTVAQHYGLDMSFGWVIWRACYRWATKTKPKIKKFSLKIAQQDVTVPGPHIKVEGAGDAVVFNYLGTNYTFKVMEYEQKSLDTSFMPKDMDYPANFWAMGYIITPEPKAGKMHVVDCAQGDRPIPKRPDEGRFDAIGIGGVDVIGRISTCEQGDKKLYVACSSLRFKPAESVEWQILFYEKKFKDFNIEITVE